MGLGSEGRERWRRGGGGGGKVEWRGDGVAKELEL